MLRTVAAASAVFLGVHAPAFAQAENTVGPLVTPAQLAELRGEADPLILDIRTGETGSGEPVYEAGHIPGAVHAAYGRFRGPSENPGRALDDTALTELFGSLGVTGERPVVVVHQGTDATDFGAAARVYWTLKSGGVSDLAILNGGMNAWTADDARPVSTETVTPTPSIIEASLSDEWLATREDVRRIVEGDGEALLLDARPEAFYKGETAHAAAARPGTIPQSEYFTHSGWFSSGPAIVEAEAARRLAEKNGLTGQGTIISFCNTGHWAATNWFALSELAGLDDVKLYPESVVGWSNAGLPLANTPGVLENLWDQVTGSL